MKRNFKVKFFCFFIVLLFVAVAIYNSSTKLIFDKGIESFEGQMSTISYQVLENELIEKTNFEDFFDISFTSTGKVSFISTNSYKVNLLAKQLVKKIYNDFAKFCEAGCQVPIGVFSGIKLLSGFGKEVSIKMISVSSAKCEFVSCFESSGINQTRQSLYLSIKISVVVFSGFAKKEVSDSIQVLVYDNIILGEIPNIYLDQRVIGGSES